MNEETKKKLTGLAAEMIRAREAVQQAQMRQRGKTIEDQAKDLVEMANIDSEYRKREKALYDEMQKCGLNPYPYGALGSPAMPSSFPI